ncbi:MAG: PAS domain S-box protein [Planctomycetia bacterium]|nr:PAS domain S-box protein [Planctomycetia bacterium]
MSQQPSFERYRDLQRYVGWTDDDGERIRLAAAVVRPSFAALVEDFYQEIDRHPATRQVITGGKKQVARLKQTLTAWLDGLFSGNYDDEYVARHWQAGKKHVEIQLDQVYVASALARLRTGLARALSQRWEGSPDELHAAQASLNKLLDLDLAIIVDAYHVERIAERQHSERLAMLAQMADCVATLVLREDFTICYFSLLAERLTGHAASAAVGCNALNLLLAEEDRPAAAAEITRVFANAATAQYENAIRCQDGSQRWILWSARRLDDFEGRPAVLTVGHDMTARKFADEQIRRKERLAAIGQTVTGLAHESRNALQRSKACLELLALEVEDRPEALDLVRRVLKSQDHLHHLLEEVRTYAAPISPARSECRLDELWRDTWAQLADDRAGRDVRLVEEPHRIDVRVLADGFGIRQVFRNILENAIAACSDPGEVRVRCREATLAGAPAVQISFLDDGPGLNPEQRQRIFEPFYTTKTRGTGLGMAIASRIVEAHNGQIAVGQSETGAEIVVTLPRS